MGNYFSRRNEHRNNLPSTISYFTNSFGLYFGPYFIMNRNENRNSNSTTRNLINEQVQNNIMTGTGLLWSDLLEAIENGVITEQELSEFGISFGQSHISEYDAPITIQSLVNLHKHSIKIFKVEYEEMENNGNLNNNYDNVNENRDECVIQIDSLLNKQNNNNFNNKNCRVQLEFEYDSYTPCQVHLFWNAREVIVKNGNERKAIYLLNHDENRNSMTIGPLPAGNNQKFVLPNVINIPTGVLDDIIKKTNEVSVSSSKKPNKDADIPNGERSSNNSSEVNTIDINSEVNNNSNNSNNNNNNDNNNNNENNNNSNNNNSGSSNIDQNDSSSGNIDNSTTTSRLRIGRNLFNHNRRDSNRSNSRSRNANKKNQREKKIVWYPLIIVLESLEKKDEKVNEHAIKYQTTLLKLEISNETNQYNIKSVDQKVMIKNNLYRLQEIYGFTDEADAGQVVTNDVNTSIECVICLSEPRNTIVLPCRHLCVCQDCADILCNQSRHDHRSNYLNTPRCPICRQIFHSFLRINMDYFNSTEDLEDKDITEKKDELSKTKGKKGNQSPEKKYDIIATSHMTEEDVEEGEAEAEIEEAKIERKEDREKEEEDERERKEGEIKEKKDREEEEEEEEEEYNKTIYEDTTTSNPESSSVNNVVTETTKAPQETPTEIDKSIEEVNEKEGEEEEEKEEEDEIEKKEKEEYYSESTNDPPQNNNSNSNYNVDNNSNNTNSSNIDNNNSNNNISGGSNGPSEYISIESLD